MKKNRIMIVASLMSVLLTGCAAKELPYDYNSGYDFSKTKYSDYAFNLYHSNTDDHHWELLKSFPFEPEDGYYYKVHVQSEDSTIIATLRKNEISSPDNGATIYYGGTDVETFAYEVEGFEGRFAGWQSFEVKNTKGEQFVLMYPIGNNDSMIIRDISPQIDLPYDDNGFNLDNLLITLEMH